MSQPECDFCIEKVTERAKIEVTDHMNNDKLVFCDWWCLKRWVERNSTQ